MYTMKYAPAWLRRHAGREQRTEKMRKKKSPLEKVLGTIMGGMGPTLHLLCACGIIKGLLVLLTFVGIKPTDGILYADEYSRRLFLLFPAADSWI